MYQQRAVPDAKALELRGPWIPAVEAADLVFAPDLQDRYAVVDDLEVDRVVVTLDRWPQVDGLGHLVFSGDALLRDFPRTRFQRLVNVSRLRAGQPAPDRPLRVGDVFWVRAGAGARLGRAVQWEILDVTGPARRVARAAQAVAASPAVRTSEPNRGGAAARPRETSSPPRAGAARPAV